MSSNSAPRARADQLIVEELADELLVYDQASSRAHCLSPTAAAVWRRCDGRTSVAAIGADLQLDGDAVERALAELGRCELLELETPSTPGAAGSTRRELALRAARVGAAAASVPLIVSVVAPLPAHAATLQFCTALGGGIGNCGNACCQAGTGCCCCVGSGGAKRCVDSQTNCALLVPSGNVSCGQDQCGP